MLQPPAGPQAAASYKRVNSLGSAGAGESSRVTGQLLEQSLHDSHVTEELILLF